MNLWLTCAILQMLSHLKRILYLHFWVLECNCSLLGNFKTGLHPTKIFLTIFLSLPSTAITGKQLYRLLWVFISLLLLDVVSLCFSNFSFVLKNLCSIRSSGKRSWFKQFTELHIGTKSLFRWQSFLALKGAWEVQILSLCLSVCLCVCGLQKDF